MLISSRQVVKQVTVHFAAVTVSLVLHPILLEFTKNQAEQFQKKFHEITFTTRNFLYVYKDINCVMKKIPNLYLFVKLPGVPVNCFGMRKLVVSRGDQS